MVCCRTVGVASLSAARRVGGPSSTLGRTSGATWVDWFQHLVLSQWCSRTLDFTVTDRTRRTYVEPTIDDDRQSCRAEPPTVLARRVAIETASGGELSMIPATIGNLRITSSNEYAAYSFEDAGHLIIGDADLVQFYGP